MDALGSVRAVVDQAGNVVERRAFLPYGQLDGGAAIASAFGFTGQRIEDGDGLYDYGARYYDASLLRFVQPDDIVPDRARSIGFNRYAYAYANPIVYVDPDGHDPLVAAVVGGVLGAFIGAVNGAMAAEEAGVSQVKGALIGGAFGFVFGFLGGYAGGLVEASGPAAGIQSIVATAVEESITEAGVAFGVSIAAEQRFEVAVGSAARGFGRGIVRGSVRGLGKYWNPPYLPGIGQALAYGVAGGIDAAAFGTGHPWTAAREGFYGGLLAAVGRSAGHVLDAKDGLDGGVRAMGLAADAILAAPVVLGVATGAIDAAAGGKPWATTIRRHVDGWHIGVYGTGFALAVTGSIIQAAK